MPASVTLIEYCPFGLVAVPEKDSPFVPLQTWAVDPSTPVIAAPPAGQPASPGWSCATVGLTPAAPGSPFGPFWFQAIGASMPRQCCPLSASTTRRMPPTFV